MQGIKRNWGFIAVVFLAFVLGMLVNGQRAESQSGQVGRYQFFQGYVDYLLEGGGANKAQAVFKIDTVTGDTWRYSEGAPGGKYVALWLALPLVADE